MVFDQEKINNTILHIPGNLLFCTNSKTKGDKFFLHVIAQVWSVCVCARACMLSCVCSLTCAETKRGISIHINVDWLVSSKRVNNVLVIRKDKKQAKIMKFIKGTTSRY